MPAKPIVLALVTFFHDLFTVAWLGGLFTLALVVLPTALGVWGRGPETRRLMDGIQRRLSPIVYVSIVGLAITGALLARRNPAYGGLLSFANPYTTIVSIKHLLMLAMAAVALLRSVALRAAPSVRLTMIGAGAGAPALSIRERLMGALLYLNLFFGLLVLLLSGISVAIGTRVPPV